MQEDQYAKDREFVQQIVVNNPEDLIKVRVTLDDPNAGSETFWALRIGLSHAKVCNIPFMCDNISLDDIISVSYSSTGGPATVGNVISRATYKACMLYETFQEDVNKCFSEMHKYFHNHGIRLEGGVKSAAMIAVPICIPLSRARQIVKDAPYVVQFLVTHPNPPEGFVFEWEFI